MIRILLPLICAALGLAAASCSQTEAPFVPADAPASPPAASQDAASAAMANPPDSPQSQGATGTAATTQVPASSAPTERRASALIGMPVVAADGSPLGEVKDVIFDPEGRATHVVIAYEIPSQAGRKLTAVPWDTVAARITDRHVVLDGAQLQGAPSFTPKEWPNLEDPSWSVIADAYWRKVARPAVAAHPGTSIDSTARLRTRPTRDEN